MISIEHNFCKSNNFMGMNIKFYIASSTSRRVNESRRITPNKYGWQFTVNARGCTRFAKCRKQRACTELRKYYGKKTESHLQNSYNFKRGKKMTRTSAINLTNDFAMLVSSCRLAGIFGRALHAAIIELISDNQKPSAKPCEVSC